MSQQRPIWNDGQGITTPDLQRICDTVGAADDKAFETLLVSGALRKMVFPITPESRTVNPRLLCIPSTSSLTPAGVNGAVRVFPATLTACNSSNFHQVALTGSLQSVMDTAAIASNSSGLIRYDLVYATLTRAVTTTGSRKIKSVVDGSISSQTINLADAPTITLSINQGFLTGATPPTSTQINSALPSDSTTSFSFALCYVTVANGYTSGTNLVQNSTGGTTFITQAWTGGFVPSQRIWGTRPGTIMAAAPSESALTAGQILDTRFGSFNQFFFAFKVLSSSTTFTLDTSIHWANRFIKFEVFFAGTETTLPIDNPSQAFTCSGSSNAVVAGAILRATDTIAVPYGSGSITFKVDSSGNLQATKGTLVDGSGGDLMFVIATVTDKILLGS